MKILYLDKEYAKRKNEQNRKTTKTRYMLETLIE